MKRIQQALAPKPSPSPSLLPPADPRQADRASRLAALTNAHYSTSSAGGLPSPQPVASNSHVSGSRRPNTAPQFASAAEEKRMLEAELVSEAVCASLRATDPEAWRAKAEASWRAQAGSVGVARVRREERLMLEAQELSAAAEEWRLRAEEAWERHLLEGDDETMQEMKDAQRRAKKYEARMMDKLALLAVTEEEETEGRAAAGVATPPTAAPPADADDRQQAALEELHKRRQAHEAAAAARRALDARRAAKAAYKTAWDSLQHTIAAYAAAAPLPTPGLSFAAFPWPLFGGARTVGDISREKVLEFIYDRPADGREESDDGARRAAVRAALKTWAPAGDRFAGRVLRHVEPPARDAVLEGHALVVRILNGELARLG